VGLSRFELLTPRLSSVCSNQLSYRPVFLFVPPVPPRVRRVTSLPDPFLRTALQTTDLSKNRRAQTPLVPSKLDRACTTKPLNTRSIFRLAAFAPDGAPASCSRKEVIQPQVLLQLPCYDFTPITDHTLGTCPPCGLAGLLLVQPAFVM
jgi:hypothetical protein